MISLTNDTQHLLSTEEVATLLNVRPKSVLRYVESGDLEAVPQMVGKRRVMRYTEEAVEAFKLKQHERLKGDEG